MRIIKPLSSFMQIRLLEEKNVEQESKGGLIIPAKASEAPRVGEVLAVGPGMYNPWADDPEIRFLKPIVEVGDLIYFLQNGPVKIVHPQIYKDEPDTYIIAEGDVLAIYMKYEDALEAGLVSNRVERVAQEVGI